MVKSTSAECGKLFQAGERKKTGMGIVQNFLLTVMGSSSFRNEKFQGNPGILFPFLQCMAATGIQNKSHEAIKRACISCQVQATGMNQATSAEY
jgi:hypothetical protein